MMKKDVKIGKSVDSIEVRMNIIYNNPRFKRIYRTREELG